MGRLFTAIGLMSGTSMDGIDVALLRTDGEAVAGRGPFLGLTYPPDFRERLKWALDIASGVTERTARPGALAEIERELTLRHALAVKELLLRYGMQASDIDLIGFHGQTVLHRPDDGLTVQIGDGPLLARETAIDVVYDMRANDMAHGGQGAPLVPAYHAALAAGLNRGADGICFVNIGGISNLTAISPDGGIAAYDSGPGNTLIDQWVEAATGLAFDQDGRIAAGGEVNEALAARYLDHPFFSANLRRSLDRNDFRPPQPGEAGLEEGARTLSHVAAAAIVKSASHLPHAPRLFVVCGGGRLNPAIMGDLTRLAAERGARVMAAEEAGFDGDAMEAEAWAYLAVRSRLGLALTFPGTTGVSEPVTGGVFAPGRKERTA